ncbi:MAG TPA: hypothetical protein VHI93_05015, partial [Candidatus Thermoplasmatota archaeon]|nr:hypothetical protein [Candidatus Thermoplasmatota archaeon]
MLLAATLALLVSAPPAAALDLGPGFRPATDAGAGPAALHGSRLAWVGQDGAIHLTDLDNGTRQTLTFLPPGTRVQSLDFDGSWVAWCDNRFGSLEAFAMHLDRLSLVRLSPRSDPATDITVGGG